MTPGGHQTPPPALTPDRVPAGVRSVVDRLSGAGHEAYLVGGCVRDLVAGRDPLDWDVATEALPAEVQRLFKKVIPTGIAHGTVTVLVPGGHVEVTTYRVEAGYADGRRPDRVEFRRDLEEDLARRDFTINAMAYDPRGNRFRDPFGGLPDLGRRLVRSVGDASARFAEDGLRPLRAVRFATVLAFDLHPDTEAAIPGALEVFGKVSPERVRDELQKLLLAPGVERGLTLLESTGLLAAALPQLSLPLPAGAVARVAGVPGRLEVRLAALLLDRPEPEAEAVLARLRLPTRTVDEVRALLAHPLPPGAVRWTDADARRWAAALGAERVGDGLALARAAGRPGMDGVQAQLERVLASRPPLTVRDLALDGREVMELLGIGPSPLVGEATRWLLEQALDAPERNSKDVLAEALLAWARDRGLKRGPSP